MCDYVHPRQLKPSKSPWGPNDQIGRLNLINAESRNKVFSFIDTSREFDLSVNYFVGMPSWTAAGDPRFKFG